MPVVKGGPCACAAHLGQWLGRRGTLESGGRVFAQRALGHRATNPFATQASQTPQDGPEAAHRRVQDEEETQQEGPPTSYGPVDERRFPGLSPGRGGTPDSRSRG